MKAVEEYLPAVLNRNIVVLHVQNALFLAKSVRTLTHLIMWTHFTFFEVLIWALIANLMTKSCFKKNWILSKQTFGREIIFEEFQPMWSRYLIVTADRRMTDDMQSHNCALR